MKYKVLSYIVIKNLSIIYINNMYCGEQLNNIVITVKLVNKNNIKSYIFIGDDITEEYKNIFTKIINKKNLSTKDEELLKDKYKNSYKEWMQFDKKNEIYFVYDYIRLDDSINGIKKKIFLYLSDIKRKYFILEKNQELWIEPSEKKYKVLGYHYINKDTDEILDIEPSVYGKIFIDENFVDKDGILVGKYDLKNEDLILYDVINIFNEKEHTIYVSNLTDFIERLKKHDIEINDRLIYGYILKHWAEGILKPFDEIKQYNAVKEFIDRENSIIKLVENVKIRG